MAVCQLSHAIKPPSCGKKGGGQKTVRVSKTLRCLSQRKLARKQNTGISTCELALWPRKWCVSEGVSNSLRPCEMKGLFSMTQLGESFGFHCALGWSFREAWMSIFVWNFPHLLVTSVLKGRLIESLWVPTVCIASKLFCAENPFLAKPGGQSCFEALLQQGHLSCRVPWLLWLERMKRASENCWEMTSLW